MPSRSQSTTPGLPRSRPSDHRHQEAAPSGRPCETRGGVPLFRFWSDSNSNDHLVRLQAALSAAKLTPTGPLVYARYDPPITPWFMRRNEIWLHLKNPP
ncbi:MAG: heme-binding protein [Comamonadaceae bacterium]|uniref:heme-binding protein n=1 Tax=Candidatus Skiveiella danica TaxID=3386177 RepID=UPI00390BE07B|nr:heme-binding protein [Comamonadaceae bacterium]